jgi:hypothetical protein
VQTAGRLLGRLLPRAELARRLKTSTGTLDRLIAAKLLKPAGTRGRAKLYRVADARRALARAAKDQSEYGRSLVGLFNAQADEARARLAELRAEWIHDRDWRGPWRQVVAAVTAELARWSRGAAGRLGPILAGDVADPTVAPLATGDRRIGYLVQAREVRPLLERLAAIRTPWPTRPAPPPAGPAPTTITGARQLLIEARSAVARFRAALKNDRARWRKRAVLEAEIESHLVEARGMLWNGVPAKLVVLGPAPAAAILRSELAAIAAGVRTTLEAVGRHGAPSPDLTADAGAARAGQRGADA